MQDPISKPSATTVRRPLKKERDRGNFDDRLKAAGIDIDEVPEDIDDFRRQLARMIVMFVNQWDGCPERICQRSRGCMAPSGRCANVEVKRTAESWAETKFKVRQTLERRLAEAGLTDE